MNQNRPKTAAELHRFYVAARSHFGYTSRWWPGTPMELTFTAVLVQQCDWTVAWKAAKRLRDAGLLNLMHLAESHAAAVTELIQVELGRHHCRKTRPRCVEAGWPGWTDEDGAFIFCGDHCSHDGCMACPLSESCAANT